MASPTGTLDTITTLQSLLWLILGDKAAMAFWRHRSRLLWLIVGDKNSSYFQAVAKGRNAHNSLYVLEDRNVNHLYEEEHIAAEIAWYFTDFFASLGADCTAVVE